MRYLEDLVVGVPMAIGSVAIERDAMVRFAVEFDPQPMHLDERTAADSAFGELIASGIYTCGLWTRLYVEHSQHDVANLGGMGIDELRFPAPVRAGDVLRGSATVTAARPSERRLDRGTITTRGEMVNQSGLTVMTLVSRARIAKRPAA
jgi:acyl dehydratase